MLHSFCGGLNPRHNASRYDARNERTDDDSDDGKEKRRAVVRAHPVFDKL